MLLVSLLVISLVLALSTGKTIPTEVSSFLDFMVNQDGTSTPHLIAAGFGVGMLAALTPVKLILRYFVTVVHELGHAFMAGALFARPKSILIHPSSSGLATWEIPENWGRIRATLVAAAGYPAPSIASLAAMNAVTQGRTIAWSIFSVGVLSLAVVLLIRNFWGFLWTSAVIVTSYFAYQRVPIDVAGALVAGIAGFLAINSIQFAWIQVKLTRFARGSGVDAEAIEHYTRVPSVLVSFGHLAVTVWLGFLSARMAFDPLKMDMSNLISALY
jgi:hypothetical protein